MSINASSVPKSNPVPLRSGHLPDSAGHRVYFAEFGCADGPASVVLHGGPGGRSQLSMLEWFDLTRQRVVLFDQRGAGLSLPAGELAYNTTADLVADIERLRAYLGIGRWHVIGGSWGAVPAILYAGSYPQRLRGLVLRGSFLTSPREMQWFFQDLQALAPQAWGRLTQGWNRAQKQQVLHSLTVLLQNGTVARQRDGAARWGSYEDGLMLAMNGAAPRALAAADGDMTPARLNKYRIQAHYLSQHCFTSERKLLRAARQADAAGIPAIIIHGTRDWICPPQNAVRLQRFMPAADLRWIAGGAHTADDALIAAALRQAVADLHQAQSPPPLSG